LKIGKREIENKVQREWERDRPRERSFKGLVKNRAKGDGDDSVQHSPHRPKNPRRWRPRWLEEGAVPVVRVWVHKFILTVHKKKSSTVEKEFRVRY